MRLKEIARKYVSAVNRYDVGAVMQMVDESYIQHNPFVPTGRSAFIDLLSKLKKHGSKIENIRIFEDGNHIVMHHVWHNATPFGSEAALAFHIIRMNQDDMIVEHWNVMTPIQRSEIGTDALYGGTRDCGPIDFTCKTRRQTALLGQELIGKQLSDASLRKFFDKDMIDYSSQLGVDTKNLSHSQSHYGQNLIYLKQHKIFAQGQFALAIAEGSSENRHLIIYDLFRYESEQIIERWNITQDIPKENLANDNTMFGFQ